MFKFLIIAFGLVVFNPLSAQKSSEKAPPKRLLPDAGYQKFLKEGVEKVRPHALTFQLLDPLVYGRIGAGYQRKLHRRILAEVNAGIGIINAPYNYYPLNSPYHYVDPSGDYYYRPDIKSIKPVYHIQGQIIHNMFGKLVNYGTGYGLFYQYAKYSINWEDQNVNKTGINSSVIGIMATTQAKLHRHLGLGVSFGRGIEFMKAKEVPYYHDTGGTNSSVLFRTDKIRILDYLFFQVKLNYLL